ncbi:carbohydrate ABC transporter permease [Rathayibacter caricis]|uniref:carbohydrate ABC transporter permease n=1 Tax=Rathayibacter caricis TaxID=110936 RepID=UPI001FB4A98D|nr:carbohydrate ABC transporter permease [Rathayibacter caricis]MCJ1695859.1 carbohydrate ABC transporter permease [Rathayibacter caricis]
MTDPARTLPVTDAVLSLPETESSGPTTPAKRSVPVASRLRAVPKYAFLTVFAIFSIFPLYFMAVSATNTSQDVLDSRMLPGTQLFENFSKLSGLQDVGGAMWNSATVAVGTTILALIVCSIAGYGFEVFHSRGKDLVMAILLIAIMIPFAATMIPLFQVFAELGMVNSLAAVIIPAISTPFLILLFRQASRSFPYEIIEAARIDGVSELGIFARIYLPSMKSTYAAAAVITFMTAWNNFLWPKVILVNNDFQTMPMLISNLAAGYVTDYGVLMLAVLLASVPTMVVFMILQRSFAEGITGAIK